MPLPQPSQQWLDEAHGGSSPTGRVNEDQSRIGSNLLTDVDYVVAELAVVTWMRTSRPHIWDKSFAMIRDRCDSPLSCALNGLDLGVDSAGDLLLAGLFRETVDFGGTIPESAGSDDIFIAKFNKDGAQQWSGAFGPQCDSEDCAISVASDWDHNTFLSGYRFGSADFGVGTIESGGTRFMAKFGL